MKQKNRKAVPLSVILISFICLAIAFVGIMLDVIHFGRLAQFDLALSNQIASFRNISLVKFFLFITVFAKRDTVIIFFLTTLAVLVILKRQKYILPLIVSVSFSSLSSLIKLIVHRPRPAVEIYKAPSFSFPSGHATISIAFFGFLAYILFKEVKEPKVRVIILFFYIIVALLIGFSRIYLGVHYFSDVIAGYILGTIGMIIGVGLSEYNVLSNKHLNINIQNISVKRKITAIILITLSILAYIYLGLTFHPHLLKNQKIFIQHKILR